MSRFKRLIENSKAENPKADQPITTSVAQFGKKGEISLTTQGPYTESDYECIQKTCDGDSCDEPILYIIEPEYNLEVGISTSMPIEIMFTEIEGDIEEGDIDFWEHHVLASGKCYVFECPECGHKNVYPHCTDGGLLLLTSQQEHVNVPIPKNRISYLAHPKSEWSLEES